MGAVFEINQQQKARLDEVGLLLRSTKDLFAACWSAGLSTPEAGSIAAKAMAEPQECATASEPWPAHLVTEPGRGAINALHKAANLITAVGGNLLMGDLMDAPHVQARQAVEYLARATWFIDPDATHRQRCARFWATEVKTFDEQTKMLKLRFPDWDDSPTSHEVQAKRDKMMADLGKWFTVTKPASSRPILDGERNLTFEDLATHWAKVSQLSGDGALLYAVLALRSHPQGLNANLDNLVDLGDGTARRPVNLADLESLAQLLAGSFYSAMSGITAFHGRGQEFPAAWFTEVVKLFPSVVVS